MDEWLDSLPTQSVVFAAILICFLFAAGIAVGKREPGPLWSHKRASIAALFAFCVTLFLAHRTIEDSNREQAETRISDEGYVLLNYEMENPELRCIYVWYDGVDPAACLNRLFASGPTSADHDAWTMTMLYVEEALWILEESADMKERYGSSYSDTIDYWRDDVEIDPTGVFSYYIVSEASEEAARQVRDGTDARPECIARGMLSESGIGELGPRLCERYRNVINHAPPAFFSREPEGWCLPATNVQTTIC